LPQRHRNAPLNHITSAFFSFLPVILGAPGLAFETWETTYLNQLIFGCPTLPRSLRRGGKPPISIRPLTAGLHRNSFVPIPYSLHYCFCFASAACAAAWSCS